MQTSSSSSESGNNAAKKGLAAARTPIQKTCYLITLGYCKYNQTILLLARNLFCKPHFLAFSLKDWQKNVTS